MNYFKWLCKFITKSYHSSNYKKLLTKLYETDFTFIEEMDKNRALDGYDLRAKFGTKEDLGNVSVLEVMIALAIKMENMMMNNAFGDRTAQWFWEMITCLGLNRYNDECYDENLVQRVITKFLNREYTRDGVGGLFHIPNCEKDLRGVEIWYQMCWYLDSIIK